MRAPGDLLRLVRQQCVLAAMALVHNACFGLGSAMDLMPISGHAVLQNGREKHAIAFRKPHFHSHVQHPAFAHVNEHKADRLVQNAIGRQS